MDKYLHSGVKEGNRFLLPLLFCLLVVLVVVSFSSSSTPSPFPLRSFSSFVSFSSSSSSLPSPFCPPPSFSPPPLSPSLPLSFLLPPPPQMLKISWVLPDTLAMTPNNVGFHVVPLFLGVVTYRPLGTYHVYHIKSGVGY